MAWTEITRRQYRRDDLRYASNLTDDEWLLITPFLPKAARLGRPRSVDLREIRNAILFIATTGCQWRQIPKEFAPFTTIQGYFYRWSRDGTLERINHALVMVAREQAGREPTPRAGVIDSQSVKTTEAGGPRGFDAGKKIKGRKRHIITDTLGHLVGIDVHPADIQDRDGAVRVIKAIRSLYPWRSCRRFRQSEGLLESSGGCAISSPMVAIQDRSWQKGSPSLVPGRSKSSNAPTLPKAFNCYPDAGRKQQRFRLRSRWKATGGRGADLRLAQPMP